METNERIKLVRQELKLSQAKFAKAISISNGYIAGIELGNRKVNERIVKLISAQFDVSERWLLTGEGKMFNGISDKNLKAVSNVFKELKPEYQDYVLEQIQGLLKLQTQSKESN